MIGAWIDRLMFTGLLFTNIVGAWRDRFMFTGLVVTHIDWRLKRQAYIYRFSCHTHWLAPEVTVLCLLLYVSYILIGAWRDRLMFTGLVVTHIDWRLKRQAYIYRFSCHTHWLAPEVTVLCLPVYVSYILIGAWSDRLMFTGLVVTHIYLRLRRQAYANAFLSVSPENQFENWRAPWQQYCQTLIT